MVRHEEAVQEELNEVRSQLSAAERDRIRALEELREIKLRLTKLFGDHNEELLSFRDSLQNADRELKSTDKIIESLQAQLDKLKQAELKLSEKDDTHKVMEQQLSLSEASVSHRDSLISESKAKLEELESQVERRKQSEAKLFDSLVNQKNQIQEASLLIDKHRLEANSLRQKVEALEEEMRQKDERLRKEGAVASGGKSATIETKTLLNEIDFLKNELKRAMEAEETKDKALEDLALALKEVASESNQAKEKLVSTEQQLEAVKEEAAILKKMIKNIEGRCEALLKEEKKENDRLTNIVNRLRLEADESLMAWSGKEIEFVKCIKKAEDEKNVAQVENSKLMRSMRDAEGISEKSKEETKKMRDILKQALNEANVAKEAAGLARTENSYLKDSLAEKDKDLISLAQETERLRISEAEANETIKELKRVLTSGTKKEVAKLEKENKELKKVAKKEAGNDTPEKEHKERKLSNTFSFDLNQFWPSIPGLAAKPSKDLDEDQGKDDALGGSIFDLVESPLKDSPQPYHRRTSSACSSTDDEANLAFENFDDDAHFDDLENERCSQGKKKALLRRFGDLLRRKNSHPTKDLVHPTKDLAHTHPPKETTQPYPHPHPHPHPPKETTHPHPAKESGHPQKEGSHPQKEVEHGQKEMGA